MEIWSEAPNQFWVPWEMVVWGLLYRVTCVIEEVLAFFIPSDFPLSPRSSVVIVQCFEKEAL